MKKNKGELFINDKVKILFTGIGEDVGTTMVSTCLAFYLAQKGARTGFCQLTPPGAKAFYLYYIFFMDQGQGWDSFYQATKEGRSIKRCCNLMDQVNWAVRLPQDGDMELTQEQGKRLINAVSGGVVLCDAAFPFDSRSILEEGDIIVAVIDPAPCKIMANMEKLRMLKKMELDGYKVVWLVNKVNEGVPMSQVKHAIREPNIIRVPWISAKEIYGCQYRQKPLYRSKEVQRAMEQAFDTILNIIK